MAGLFTFINTRKAKHCAIVFIETEKLEKGYVLYRQH